MPKWDLQFSVSGQNSVLISDVSHEFYMPSPSHSHSFCNHEQYTPLLQFSTSPNDCKYQQVKNCTQAVQHF